MGFGERRDEKRAARRYTIQEIIVLWSCHEETRRQPGEGNHARHVIYLQGPVEEEDNVSPG